MKKFFILFFVLGGLALLVGSSTQAIFKSTAELDSNQITVGEWEEEAGTIIITEFMANPYKVVDSKGEWLEIYNPTLSSIDLNGWRYRDKGLGDWTIISSSLVIPSQSYLVFVKNTDPTLNGGINGGIQLGSSFNLANTKDEIVIEKPIGGGVFNEIDRVVYDKDGGYTISSGKSNILLDLTLDNLLATSWGQSTVTYGLGDYGTPGGPNV